MTLRSLFLFVAFLLLSVTPSWSNHFDSTTDGKEDVISHSDKNFLPSCLTARCTLIVSQYNCDGTVTLQARAFGFSSPYTFSISPSSGVIGSDVIGPQAGSTANFTVKSDGTEYTLQVNGECIDIEGTTSIDVYFDLIVNNYPALTANYTSTNIASCGGKGSISMNSSNGGSRNYTFTLSPGGASNTSGNFNNLNAGNYTVTVTDNVISNCSKTTGTISITSPTAPGLTITNVVNPTCTIPGSFTASGTGSSGYQYSLDNSTYSNPNNGSKYNYTGLASGTYTVYVKDGTQCTRSATVSLAGPPGVSLGFISPSTPFPCTGGTITVSASGGTGLSYSINTIPGISSTGILTGLNASTTYTITVTNSNGCSATTSYTTPTANNPINNVSISATGTTCGLNNGQIIISSITGGDGNYHYSWNPGGGTTSSLSNIPIAFAGTPFSVTVTDGKGCSKLSNFDNINSSAPGPSSVTATGFQPACGSSTGAIQFSATGGTTPYTFSCSAGSTSSSPYQINAASGQTYTNVLVTDNKGCTATGSNVIVPNQPGGFFNVTVATTNITCNGTANGTVTANTDNPNYTYTYTWSNGKTTKTVTGLGPTSFLNVTVSDQYGCSDAASSTSITQPASAVSVSITGTQAATCGVNNGSATAGNATGGNGVLYTYTWTPGGITGQTLSNAGANIYTVTAYDNKGCTATATANITSTGGPVASIDKSSAATDTVVNCVGSNEGFATATATGAGSPFSYSWNTSPPQLTPKVTGLSAGIYSCKVSNSGGTCSTFVQIKVINPTPVNLTPSATTTGCAGPGTGTASVTAAGGTNTYTYSWSTGATTSSISNLTAATYTITVKDGNNCPATATVSVGVAGGPTASIVSSTPAKCSSSKDGTATVSASGGGTAYTYTWSTVPPQNNPQVTGLTANTTYTVTIKDNLSCTVTATVKITAPVPIVINKISTTSTPCGSAQGTASVSSTDISGGTPAYSFSWSTGATTQSISNLVSGNYTLTVTDKNSCTATAVSTVSNSNGATVIFLPATNVKCNGGSDGKLSVQVTGGVSPYSYTWSPGGATTSAISNLSAGIYTVQVKDGGNCITTVFDTITEPGAITYRDSTVAPLCGQSTGEAFVKNVTGGGGGPYTYSWSTGATSTSISGLISGVYSITITDQPGCSNTGIITISNAGAGTASISSFKNITCNGGNNGNITVAITGGVSPYTFAWLPKGGTSSTANNLEAGIYTVNITDKNGCLTFISKELTEPAPIAFIISSTNTPCTDSIGTVSTTTATGGTGTYTYLWSGSNATTTTVTGLPAGIYTLTVKDQANCISTASVTVANSGAGTASVSVLKNVTCNNGNDARLRVIMTGGQRPFNYSWSPGGASDSIITRGAGNYIVAVTDAQNCIVFANKAITEPSPVVINTTVVNPACGSSNGSVTVTGVTGGNSPYTYTWLPVGSTASSLTGLASGAFTVTATDNSGCTATKAVAIGNTNGPVITSIPVTNASCRNNDGTITINTLGSGVYEYSINNGSAYQASNSFNNLSSGTYQVIVKDATNCKTVNTVVISSTPVVNILSTTTQDASCGNTDGGISIFAQGGSGTLKYSIDNGVIFQVSNIFSGLSAVNYEVVVRDSVGCTSKTSISLNSINGPVINNTTIQKASCKDNDGSITINASTSTGSLQYSITNGGQFSSGNLFNGLASGTYAIVVKNSSGCQTSANVHVGSLPGIAISIIPTYPTCGSNDGSIKVVATGGNGSLQYSVDNGVTFQPNFLFGNLGAGIYAVVVKDESGCETTQHTSLSNSNGPTITSVNVINASCGIDDGIITVNATPANGLTYSSDNGTTWQNSPTFSSLGAGLYSIVVKDATNCSAYASVTVQAASGIAIKNVSATDVTCTNGGSIILQVAGGSSPFGYSIDNGITFQSKNGFYDLSQATYTIVVKDGNNCRFGGITVQVGKTEEICDTKIHIYTGITPNDNGKNDTWEIDNIDLYPDNTVKIFNRWGNRVWETEGYDNSKKVWKGDNQDGQPLPDGTYFYIVTIKDQVYKGWVELTK